MKLWQHIVAAILCLTFSGCNAMFQDAAKRLEPLPELPTGQCYNWWQDGRRTIETARASHKHQGDPKFIGAMCY